MAHLEREFAPAAMRDAYRERACWYCQGVGYVERIPVKRHGRVFIGPSRVKCAVCDGSGRPGVGGDDAS